MKKELRIKWESIMNDKRYFWLYGNQFLQISIQRSLQDGVLRADLQPHESIQHLYVFKQCGAPTQAKSSYKFEQIPLTS